MSPAPSSRSSPEAFDPREQAERCRRLARTATDQRALEALNQMASEFEECARGSDAA